MMNRLFMQSNNFFPQRGLGNPYSGMEWWKTGRRPLPGSLLFHDGYGEDEHEHLPFDEKHPLWHSERISLNSVGIDIGSSTSHLIFSHLVLRRQGIALSNRFVVIKRDILYESPIMLTPYIDKTTIDTGKLQGFIREAYQAAGFTAEGIDTGAVIVTGEAAKKNNAEAIARLFAAQTGKFVCATAGHNLEAILAAYGSGAAAMTQENGADFTVMNIDIGGGTSKIAIVQKGVVLDTAAVAIGARLVAVDENGKISRLEDTVLKIADAAGVSLSLGRVLKQHDQERLAEALCNSLFEVVERRPLSPLVQQMMLTPELRFKGRIDAVIFSGGVSEYIYDVEKRNFGDLGRHLGRRVRERASQVADGTIAVKAPDVRIRATVIGASQYAVQVSGNSIYISHPELLPLRNLQVVAPHFRQESTITSEEIASAVEKALQRCDNQHGERAAAIAVRWELGPSYSLTRTLARGLVGAMKSHLDKGQPLVLVFDADIAKLMGTVIEHEYLPGAQIISIDGIDLKDFDFIDIGKELPNAKAVPVVIKSLVFRDVEHGRGHSHHHHHHHH
jgi:ethanolamine utilization protein EutA